MAFSITTRKELIKHVPFDVSVITDNLKDGMFFAEDKKITPNTKVYVVKIPKASMPSLRKLKFKSGKIEIDIDDTKTKLRLQTTGKTTVGSSDGKTTAMQERASLVVIQDAIQNRKTYTNVVKFMASPIFKKVVEVYPDVNETWCAGLLAQAKKMKTEFTGAKFDTYNRDGGFMDWVSSHIKTKYGISQKDTWNPADIWLINKEKTVMQKLESANTIEQLNDEMRRMYKKRELCGISLKAVSGKTARFLEVNMSSDIPNPLAYELSNIVMKMSIDGNNKLDSTDTVIHVSGESHSSKFQIRQNSKGFNNLKFEPTQVGAGAARLGKVPLDMLKKLLPDYGIKDFTNRWQDYPHNGLEFEEVGDEYVEMFEEIHSDTDNRIKKDEFYNNIANSFMTSDSTNGYTTSKLMQLKFVHRLMTLSESKRNQLLTEMLYLAKKMGPRFGPHGKLY